MTWAAGVPFPAEDLSTCKGCPARIGWIDRPTKNPGDRPRRHPVEAKGWAGVPLSVPGPAKVGYTRSGEYARVVEPLPGVPARDLVVVFESHFAFCPKAKQFGTRPPGGAR